MPRLVSSLLVSVATLSLAACNTSSDHDSVTPTVLSVATITGGQPMLRTIEVSIDDTTVVVEVADDSRERGAGLSVRSALNAGTGMLFVWEEETQHTLWMNGMLFDLDLVWLDANRTVVSIDANVSAEPGVPTSQLTQYHPISPAKYAIELNAGEAEAFGIEAGDVLAFDERE